MNGQIMTFLNPYLEAFLEAKKTAPFGDYFLRERLVAEYAWAIPSEPVIRALQRRSPICDLGCGTGYWAYLLAQAAARVIAVDAAPPLNGTNHWHRKEGLDGVRTIHHYHEIIEGRAETFDVPEDHALLLCWPPYDEPMAEIALSRYQGNCVIYVGEGGGGCTGNATFHAELETRWKLVERLAIPQWIGLHDDVRVYERSTRSRA